MHGKPSKHLLCRAPSDLHVTPDVAICPDLMLWGCPILQHNFWTLRSDYISWDALHSCWSAHTARLPAGPVPVTTVKAHPTLLSPSGQDPCYPLLCCSQGLDWGIDLPRHKRSNQIEAQQMPTSPLLASIAAAGLTSFWKSCSRCGGVPAWL